MTSGYKLLKPEESESFSAGLVMQPAFIEGLTLTFDYWAIDQTGLIGIIDSDNYLALDWALRESGMGPSPNITRAAPTPENIAYFNGSGLDPVGRVLRTENPCFNLESRETAGVDISIAYVSNTNNLGTFNVGINAAKLLKADQPISDLLGIINAQGDPAVFVQTGGDLIEQNQRPEWKGSGFVKWNGERLGASLFVNYIGEFNDTSVLNDVTNIPWRVDSWTTVNVSADYHFGLGRFGNSTVRVGINNLFDEDPPLADENFNYQADLHNPFGQYAYINVTFGLGE